MPGCPTGGGTAKSHFETTPYAIERDNIEYIVGLSAALFRAKENELDEPPWGSEMAGYSSTPSTDWITETIDECQDDVMI